MNPLFGSRMVLAVGLMLVGLGCSTVEPAGSLGVLVDGETRFRPVPKNYRHVRPIMEEPVPQFKITF